VNQVSNQENQDELYVLWTSGDRNVALSMVFMYTFNSKAKGWWEDVCLIVWGPSAKLLAEDAELQDRVRQMLEASIDVVACRACADMYGVSEILEKLGVEVKGMGHPLSQLLKAGKKVLSI
jgi:hypothetical protein